MTRPRPLLCLGLLLCACRGEQPAREPAAASTASTDTASAVAVDTPAASDSAPAADLSPARAPAGPRQDTAVVRSLTDGDRGCYVVLEDEGGARFDRIAPFELCERRELVGRRARITLGPGAVAADSCQGNPECTESDTVEVLKAAEALP
ncbi:MAG: hypothetical protein ABW277_08800 [Longimicrobiaceae bacterium]